MCHWLLMSWLLHSLTDLGPHVAGHLQAKKHHESELQHSHELHLQQMDLSVRQHEEAIELAKTQCDVQMGMEMKSAFRENLRDVWDQKSNRAQTLMVIDTLMFACGFGVILEGTLPVATPQPLVMLYAISAGTALSASFLSLWFVMNVMQRMNFFDLYNPQRMYYCGKTHSSFEGYYHCHCKFLSTWASRCFYLGTCCLMVTAGILMYCRLDLLLHRRECGVVFVLIVLVTILSVPCLKFMFPVRTRSKVQGQLSSRSKYSLALDYPIQMRGTHKHSNSKHPRERRHVIPRGGRQERVRHLSSERPLRCREALTMNFGTGLPGTEASASRQRLANNEIVVDFGPVQNPLLEADLQTAL